MIILHFIQYNIISINFYDEIKSSDALMYYIHLINLYMLLMRNMMVPE